MDDFFITFLIAENRTAQKHGYKSVPDSIAGLSKSGVNAKHTGKTCSHLELVVRECGLMLQRMVSVFLFVGHAFLRICRIRSVFPGPREIGEGNQETPWKDSFPICHVYREYSGRNAALAEGKPRIPVYRFLISLPNFPGPREDGTNSADS